jgi:hypothetical protein
MSNNLPLALNPNGWNVGIGIVAPTVAFHVQSTAIGDILKVSSGAINIFRVATDTSMALDTAKVTIGSGNSTKPDALARDQLYVFGRVNSSWDSMRCDFLGWHLALAVDTYQVCGGFGYDFVTGGSLANISLAGISGSDRISTTAVANTAGALSSMGQLVTERSLNPVIESRVIVNTATARAVVGLTDLALNGAITADTNNATNEIFFRKTAAGTTWQTVTRSAAGVETVTATAVTTAAMRTLRVEVNNLASKVFFYIDGSLVATHTTGIPLAAARLGHWVGITASAATISTLDIDYIKVWSDDPDSTMSVANTATIAPMAIDFDTLKGVDTLPEIVWNSRSVLKDINYIYDHASQVVSSASWSKKDTDSMTIDEYANYTANTMKRSLEKISGQSIDTDLVTKSLRAPSIYSNTLCLDGTCIWSGQLASLISGISPIQNICTTTVVQQITSTGTTLSVADQSIFSVITATIDSVLIKVQTTFAEMVTFVKSVVFQSAVIFQDRITFEDHDMAGTAVIRSGAHSVRIDFNRVYTVTPRVTVTADSFVIYRVTAKGVRGFTIETESPVSSDTSFDWIALQVVWAHISDSTTTPPVVVSETIPGPIVISGSTGSTTLVATPVDLIPTIDSGTVAPVGAPISTDSSGSVTSVLAPIVDTPTVTDTPVAPTEPIVPIDIPSTGTGA